VHQLVSVQYMRAMVALMVLAFHAGGQLQRLGLPVLPVEWLASRLEIFFVISGLVMWVTTASPGRDTPSPLVFLWRRAMRIAPPYWVLTSVVVAVSLLAPSLLRSTEFDADHVLASYLFIPWPHPVLGETFPVLVPGWTLQCEMAFYLIFALSLFLPRRTRFWAVGTVLLGLALTARLLPDPSPQLRFYGSELMPLFWLGMALGHLVVERRLPGARLSLGLIALSVLLMPVARYIPGSELRGLASGMLAGAVVLGAVGLEAAGRVPARRLPILIGDMSYGIYLVHAIVLAALAAVWARLPIWGGAVSSVLYLLTAIALSILGALAMRHALELPLRRFMRRGVAAPVQARAV